MVLFDTTTWIALLVGAVVAIWYWFFRGETDTTTSFNPTPGTTTAFKSVNVSNAAAKKAVAPKISKKQRAKNENKPYVMVLFGSQTGTAEDFGEQLVGEMEAYGIVGDLKDMEDVDGETLAEERHVIFLVATYGEGEPTDNAKDMWEWLSKDADVDEAPLKEVRFGVFGLGNKTYEHYNWMGRKMNERLAALGAVSILPYGEGDDDATLEDDFSEWKKSIWEPLCQELGVKSDPSQLEGVHRTWKWEIQWEDERDADTIAQQEGKPVRQRFTGKVDPKKRVFDKDHPFASVVENVHELMKSDRGCLHADVRLPKGVRYEEGDHLGLYPQNARELIDAYLDYFKLDGTRRLRLLGNTDKDRGQVVFGPASLSHAMELLVDLQERPRKSVLEKFLAYCNPEQETALRRFLEKDVYVDEVEHRFMTVLEILRALPQEPLKVPAGELLQILPPLLPRYYSISSSMRFINTNPSLASITCARVDYVSPTGRQHPGVASHWLYRIKPSEDPVYAFIRASSFRMPTAGRPAIMIGPGTGLAPFMGFLQRRLADKKARGDAAKPSEDVLFTGFRTRDEYLYGEQLEAWAKDGLVELHVAFSRADPAKKHYVQHDLEAQGDRVWELIEKRKANVYICGDANFMEKDVTAALVRIFAARLDGGDAEAARYLEKMVSLKQLQKDTWF